jgi:N-acetyl-anhydromuramyl-L-alanine amidase AmpD
MSPIPSAPRFIPARNYTRGRIRPIRLIVWHDMEALERHDTAENVALWFAGPSAPQASAHVCVDDDSVVECVRLADTAWAAPKANADGAHIELAGFASQSRADWTDDFSRATIANAVAWVKTKDELAHIPWRWLTDAEIRDGKTAGHIEHRDASRAFGTPGGHQDAGPNFPRDLVMQLGQVSAYDPTALSPVLHRGSIGPKVADVQRALDKLDPRNKTAATDGVGHFGSRTEDILKTFQLGTGRHLKPTGITDLATWAALRAVAHPKK